MDGANMQRLTFESTIETLKLNKSVVEAVKKESKIYSLAMWVRDAMREKAERDKIPFEPYQEAKCSH